MVYFQGHPEYDQVSLLKEYKREVARFYHSELSDHPPFSENYFDAHATRILNENRQKINSAKNQKLLMPEFPETVLLANLDITWRDTARALISNWLGWVYQTTHSDRRIPFMDHIDPENPFGLENTVGRQKEIKY